MTSDRFRAAVDAFDAANSRDPTTIVVEGRERPRELVQAERISRWVERLEPQPSEALRLAARCQHLRRWEIPRSEFPEGRTGYLTWRSRLAEFHADAAEETLRGVGYDDETVERVRRINLKRGIRSPGDSQTMEDALCLSFLENELEEFASKHADHKVVDVLRKTWRKMTPKARDAALGLSLSERALRLVQVAVKR